MARARHLLRLFGSRLALRQPGQPRDVADAAHAGDAGRSRAAAGLDQGRARPRDQELHETTGPRIRLGRRRRDRSAAAGADAGRAGGAGIKTREEARAELGLGGEGGGGVAKYNDNHDERGRFATAGNAAQRGESAKPRKPQGVQVASNDAGLGETRTDALKNGLPEICQRNIDWEELKGIEKLPINQSTRQDLPPPTTEELRADPNFRTAMMQALSDSGLDLPPDRRKEQGFWVFQDQTTGALSTVPMLGSLSNTQISPDSPHEIPGSVIVAWAHTHPFQGGDILPLFPKGLPGDIIRCPSTQDLAFSLKTGLSGFLVTKSRQYTGWSVK